MTKTEARRFKERWRLVNQAVIEETRNTPAREKLQQLAVMYEAAQLLGWSDAREKDETQIRERWRRLQENINASR